MQFKFTLCYISRPVNENRGFFCQKQEHNILNTKVFFHFSGLADPDSQSLNGTHEFAELVLARMTLLMDQSRSVFPLRSEFQELWRASWTFSFKLARTGSSWPARTDSGQAAAEGARCVCVYLLMLTCTEKNITNFQ